MTIKKKRKSRRKNEYMPNMVTVIIGNLPYLVRVKPAKEGTSFVRERKHCEAGTPGECGGCANALAGMEAGLGLFCASFDSRFISIEKVVKTKKHGIHGIGTIWESDQGKFQRKYDDNKAALLEFKDAVGLVRLYPYRQKRPPGTSRPSGLHTGHGHHRKMTIPGSKKGALNRARRSGLLSQFKMGGAP